MKDIDNIKLSPMLLLIQGCIRNNRDSQRLLYKHYYGYALSICVRYCQTYEEAREVANDGFLKCFRNISQYKMETSFKGWLRRIMVNASIDHYRREKWHYQATTADNVDQLSMYDSSPTVYDQLSHEELLQLMKSLSPAYRAVFNLYVIDGYTHKEIARMLGISEGTSKSNLAKARARLKEMLTKHDQRHYAKSV